MRNPYSNMGQVNMVYVSEDALNSLKAMAEQDAKDAARYRAFIKSSPVFEVWFCGEAYFGKDQLDSALDAYMQTK